MPLLSDLSSRCLKCHLCLLSASPIWSFLSIYGRKKKKNKINPVPQWPDFPCVPVSIWELFWGTISNSLLSVPPQGSGSFDYIGLTKAGELGLVLYSTTRKKEKNHLDSIGKLTEGLCARGKDRLCSMGVFDIVFTFCGTKPRIMKSLSGIMELHYSI